MDSLSLAHAKWKCQYHIVFIPKYRRKVLYGKIRVDVKEAITKLCAYKNIEIVSGAVCIDHVHLCVSIPPKIAVSKFVGSSPFPVPGMEVSDEEFQRLLKIPMVVYFGDNIITGSEPDKHWGLDNWRVRLNLARKWEQVMKKHGGDVQVVYLPDIGIKGNTHFLMADLNNQEVADTMEKWMKDKGLSK